MERKPELSKRLRSQTITLENREMLSISGVRNVEEFNETDICLDTDCGILHVDGENLHITKLNLDEGLVLLEGEICGIVYENDHEERQSMWSRLFK